MKPLSAAIWALLATTLAVATAAVAAPVGQVTFAAGEARLEGGAAVARGMAVEVGQRIVTGAGGHVHVRFVDDAFVAVRPNSQLSVDDYTYDAAVPANNRVRFTLSGGTGRLITGKGGQANKQGFRLNTPLAAIGVRGTDFVVRADADRTLVAVQQGAVVVSPFAGGCSADGLGPCGGALARQLTASLAGTYLEQRGQGPPRLVQIDPAKLPQLFAPARSEEPAAAGSAATPAAGPGDMPRSAATTGSAPAGFTGSANIFWGRWDTGNNASIVNSGDYQVIAEQNGFVLLRPVDGGSGLASMLPDRGSVSFRLVQATAFIGRNGNFAEAVMAEPRLQVDFGRSTFDTSAVVQSGMGTERFRGRGRIDGVGLFVADPRRSNAEISGGLSNLGTEAGYVFLKRDADGGLSAIGVTGWQR